MRDGNTMTRLAYIGETVFWLWIGMFWFRYFCFMNFRMPGSGELLDYYESYQLMRRLILGLTAFGALLTFCRRRRGICVLINMAIPMELYLMPVLWEDSRWLLSGLTAVWVVALVFYAWVIFAKSKGNAGRKCIWLFHGARIIAGLVFLPVILYSAGAVRGVFSVAQADRVPGQVCQEDTIDHHIETLCLLEESSWKEAGREAQAEVLQTIAAIEARYLGLKRIPQVKLAYLEANILGQYSAEKNMVSLNVAYMDEESPEMTVEVLLHEIYHAYQRQMTDAYQAMPEEYQNMPLFRRAKTYETEFREYKDDYQNYDEYASQSLEEDARWYAADGGREYFVRVSEYLEEKQGGNEE
jgi:predicted SprT family Zn-dependent metalloprotease